jgi:hypothetical protein
MTGRYGRHSSIVEFDDRPSTIDPEHMFKVGYFRSSYNEGGIDSVMRHLGLPGLSEIFGVTGDEYNVRPDWDASLARCEQAIAAYGAHLAGSLGRFKVTELSPMYEFGAADEKSALELFGKELERLAERSGGANGFSNYSNGNGEFFLGSPMKVHAAITKTFKPGGSPIDRILNRPTVFLVYEVEPTGKEDWYLTALKIVRETIEFVLAQPDKQHFYMAWSG